jgi:choline dehydrogenase-like flavoprotein
MLHAGEFDYVIVGAGSAGSVLANRLSADGRYTVALVEAGGRDTYPWIHIPVGYLYCIGNPLTDWGFFTRPEPGLGGRAIRYPRGRTLGGCSSINGMLYIRGQSADYDGWRQQGLTGWGWDDVLPFFKRSEDHVDGASDLHGAGGEWRVERPRSRWDCPRRPISTPATMRGWATFRSTRRRAGAGTHPRRSCGPPRPGKTSRS